MKKYLVLSSAILAFTYTEKVTGTTKVEGGPDVTETKDVTKDICASQGTILELPEDNQRIKALVEKGLIELVVEEPIPATSPEPSTKKK